MKLNKGEMMTTYDEPGAGSGRQRTCGPVSGVGSAGKLRIVLLLAIFLLPGCVAQEMATDFANTVRGDYYLNTADTASGLDHFRNQVTADPDNPVNNYYLGRLLLREKKYAEALPYLKKAGELEPANGDYQFWTGVAHGGLKQYTAERARYQKALQLDPENQQVLTALGHSHMRSKQYNSALKIYGKALLLWPDNPSALYNRALALSKLGKKEEAKSGWRRYLSVNDSGGLARYAVNHLNDLGDFSYRNYTIGGRVVTVKAITFTSPSGAELSGESRTSLERIGEAAARMGEGKLQVLVYHKGDKELAKARALAVRSALLDRVPELGKERIGASWFGESYRNRAKKYRIDQSVDFFLQVKRLN